MHITENLHTGNRAQYEPEPFATRKCLLHPESWLLFFYSISDSLSPRDKRWRGWI